MTEHGIPRFCAEFINEIQRLDPCLLENAGEVDLVEPALEVLNNVWVLRCRIADAVIHKRVCPCTAVQLIGTLAARKAIVALVSRQGIVASTADGIFDNDALGNRYVPAQASHVRKRLSLEVDGLVLGKPGEIERIVTAAIPDGKNRLVTPLLEAVDLATGIGIEAIGSVGIAGLRIGAIEPLCCRDIVHHRCRRAAAGKLVPRLMGLGPIAHDTACLGVLCIFGTALVVEALAIVFTWMTEPQGMPQFMDQQTQKVAAHGRVLPTRSAYIGLDFCMLTERKGCPASRSASPLDSDLAIGV